MSIRRLGADDRAALHALAAANPEANLYLLGNLETLGLGAPFCEFWGDFADDATPALRGVANRYFTGWSVYGRADADWQALAALIDADPSAERLQDNPGGVASLLPWLHHCEAVESSTEELMRLDAAAFAPQPTPEGWLVRRAGLEDLDALSALYTNAGDMSRSRAGSERPLRDGRVFVACAAAGAGSAAAGSGGGIASAALTNAETHTPQPLAMIGGVYTRPAQRGLGLSRAVCSALCASLLHDGLTPVLYWDTPAAGHVYRTLGFHAVGAWRSVWLRRK